jgi:hypothetical protein
MTEEAKAAMAAKKAATLAAKKAAAPAAEEATLPVPATPTKAPAAEVEVAAPKKGRKPKAPKA